MFSVRCTRKLLDRLPAKIAAELPAPTTVLGDWYANLVLVRRQQMVVCISERTLLPVIVTAKDVGQLPRRVALAAEVVLREIGASEQDIASELAEMQVGQVGPTRSRKILGSLNDFVLQFEHGARTHPHVTLLERTLQLTRMPCGPLEYGNPRDAVLAAFAARKVLQLAKGAA